MMDFTTNAPSPPTSRFLKTVVLTEWWLIKTVEEKEGFPNKLSLGVAGFTTKHQQAVRAFTSAPIRKTYDVFTLETVDGITVILRGFINKLRTKENGFPDAVFDHFVFGFPPFWEDYMGQFFESGSNHENGLEGTPKKNRVDITKSKCTKGENMGSSPPGKGISAEKSGLFDTNTAVGLGDVHEGTPNRNRKGKFQKKEINRKGISKSRNTNCDDLDLNQASEGSTISKRVLRSSTRLSNAINLQEDTPNKNGKKLITKSKVTKCDNKYSTPAAKQNEFHTEDRQKSSYEVKKTSNSKTKTRKELKFVKNPSQEGSLISPQISSLKKSRSGRKLLPTLEFWRNQTAVYDMENKLTFIKSPTSAAKLSKEW